MSGILSLPWWGYVLVALGLTHVTIVSVTLYLHRYQAHRALEMSPVLSHFFRFWLWMTTGMKTREWVAVHRKHHDVNDTEEDPHSPWIYGIYKVLFLGAWLYRVEANKEDTISRYGQGTPDDWMERNVYMAYGFLGIFLALFFNVILFGLLPGFLIWGVQMAWIPFWAAGVINGLGHWLGYRNFDTDDGSSNIVPWGVWIGGEELHNNHHAFANSAKFSQRPWEFDLGWMYIKVFEAIGLVKIKRVAPTVTTVPDPECGKLDTAVLQTILANRQHVMANYCNEVIRRVCSEEMVKVTGRAREHLRKIRHLALRGNGLCVSLGQQKQMLEPHTMIRMVYQYKERLQAIWQRRAGTASEKKALLEYLHQWQAEATDSGIRALSEFAASLPGYQQKLYHQPTG